ncbi:MAG TPA: mechanosensitive ion channel family protein [Caldithrix abyssi]|uniref:Mechanosensitive ion channel family protein n=1 Tax=Caldithrix abyssi TaxID=187145 RepID=A0A7V5H1N2_CALAY|nr:mechanosensitive ion channel family protein [Caldithrix abyssi]
MDSVFQKFETVFTFTLFSINQTPVTLASIILFFLMIVLFYLFSKIFNRFLLKRVLNKFGVEPGLQFTLMRVSHYLLIITGIIIAFQFIGIDLSGLAIILGLLSVGIGFGLQNITSNFVAGLILLFERPIQIGDRVMIGDLEGDVTDINIRSTTIRTLNNVSIIVPNSEFISNKVVNWSHGDTKVRIEVNVGVAYSSDLDLVLKTLKEIALEHPKVLKRPEPQVIFESFGDSAWNLNLRVWLPDPHKHHQIKSELNCAIVRKFRERNIEIPFPQQDVYVKELPVSKEN